MTITTAIIVSHCNGHPSFQAALRAVHGRQHEAKRQKTDRSAEDNSTQRRIDGTRKRTVRQRCVSMQYADFKHFFHSFVRL
jgi:hypothetical protein